MKGDFIFDNDQRRWEEEPDDDETVEYDYDEPGEEVDNWF